MCLLPTCRYDRHCVYERKLLTKSELCALAASSSGLRSIASSSEIRTLSALETQGAGMLLPLSPEPLERWLASWTNRGATACHIALGHSADNFDELWTPVLMIGERRKSFAASRKDETFKEKTSRSATKCKPYCSQVVASGTCRQHH